MDDVTDLDDPNTQPQPEGGWSESIVELADAIVVPPIESDFVQAAGVLASDGSYCASGALWRKYRPLTTEPAMPEKTETLAGRWLWGGVLWAHFGHFLVESTARLWALDQGFDGVLFIPKRPRRGENIRSFQRAFVDMIVPEMPIRVAADPLRVEQLVVPGQGFGLGQITQGTPAFRNAIHSRFAQDVKPDGPERLYISRSALGLGKGGLLGEEHLETLLADEGYEIFHPQKHDMQTQLARYKAARNVVAADGSALHMYAMVGGPEQKVAMILRRQSGANNLLASNLHHFCETEPVLINALRTEWVRAERGKSDRLSFGELNHAQLGRVLNTHGFVSKGETWKALDDTERKQVFDARGMSGSNAFIESPKHLQRRIRAMRQERRRNKAVEQG